MRQLAAAACAVLVATFVLSVVTSPGNDEPYTADVVTDPAYWLTGGIVGLAIGALALLLLAPRAGVWAAALSTGTAAIGCSGVPLVVCTAGTLALLALAGADASARAKQHLAARSWTGNGIVVPGGEPLARSHAVRWRGGWTAFGILALVGFVFGAGWFVKDTREAEQFRAAATEAEGTVVEVTDDELVAVVAVDELDLSVPLPSTTPEVGTVVAVRYDGSGRAELLDDVFDPSLVLLPTGASAIVGVAVLALEKTRRRRVRALLVHGAPAVEVRATWDGRDVRITTSTGARPFAAARDLMLLSEPPTADEPESAYHRPVETVSDDELLELVQGSHEEPAWAPDSPPTWQGTPVLAVGLVADGHPVALRGPDDRWYVTETVVESPRSARRHAGAPARSSAPGATAEGAAERGLVGQGETETHVDVARPLLRAAVRTGQVGPWLAAALVLPLAVWIAPEVSPVALVPGSAAVAWALHSWSWESLPALAARPRALVVRGPLLDTHLPWHRVEAVIARADALVVRVGATSLEPADAILLQASTTGGLVHGASDTFAARDALLAAHDRAVAEAAARDSVRRPSRSAVVAALGVATLVGGVLLGG